MPRRPLPKVEGSATVERGVVPGAARVVPAATFQAPAPATTAGAPLVGVVVKDPPTLPEPHEPLSDGAKLTDREREELAACEEAIRQAQRSFITSGRALAVIRDGRHYKETHRTFDEYLESWDISRQEASRRILAYPLGEKLSRIRDKINLDQVLKLLPVADRHGDAAAELILKTVADARGGRVTAAALKAAAEVVPEEWDPDVATARVRARLAGELVPGLGVTPEARTGGENTAETFVDAVGKAWGAIQRAVREDVVRAAAAENPGYVRKVAADLRGLADELEKAVP